MTSGLKGQIFILLTQILKSGGPCIQNAGEITSSSIISYKMTIIPMLICMYIHIMKLENWGKLLLNFDKNELLRH